MPDFSKFKAKQVESQKDLTVPEGFELESEKRRKQALSLRQEKQLLQEKEENSKRLFKSKPLPDFEQKDFTVMPSKKPITVAIQPHFSSDTLPKREIPVSRKGKNSPKDFVF